MRLYLSSYQLGNQPEELVRLIGKNKKVAVIVNASDDASQEVRDQQLDNQIANMQTLGLVPEELDLRDYFGNAEKLHENLNQYGAVWVKGGNVFVLKRAYEQSGFDHIIKGMLERDEIVYAGYSAGVCIVAPVLNGLEVCDNPGAVPEGYSANFSWNGMGIVGYSILPHYQSDHPETHMIDRVVEYMQENKMPFKTLRDGEAIVVHGSRDNIVGGKPTI